jgi:aminopeptidase N
LFPALGNPGIDVVDYDVELSYDHSADRLSGSVTLQIDPIDDRPSFTLDSDGPVVSAVTVDGTPASFRAEPPELRITPAAPLQHGRRAVVVVTYTVEPLAGTSDVGLPSGWYSTAGGSYVLDEPDGTRTWLPSDDHPSDKATFTFGITVPDGVTAVANGRHVGTTPTCCGASRWEWREDRPMATYLIQVLTGHYDIVESTGPHGLPIVSAVLSDRRADAQPYLDTPAAQITFLEQWFGPYPLDRYGIAITDSEPGLAMETQERSMFSTGDLAAPTPGEQEQFLLSHELAHQWFGDAVTPARWRDIWLNESFATYAQWMWLEHAGFTTISDEADSALDRRRASPGATGGPSADDLFGFNSYEGGAIALHALRLTIGDDAFFGVLRRWVTENNGSSRTTADFEHLAELVSGQDLHQLFADWVFAVRPPRAFPTAGTAATPSTVPPTGGTASSVAALSGR